MKKSNWHGGKGSQRRNSDDKKYADNWDRIFGPKKNLNSNNTEQYTHSSIKNCSGSKC